MAAAFSARRGHGRPLRAVAWLLAALLSCAWPALAGSLQVSPILLEFEPGQQAQGIWLSNTGEAPIRAQVRVKQWSQDGTDEALMDTESLVASPPILQIGPGERQLVRIVRLQPGAVATEQSFRLLVDELPAEADRGQGLQFLLRYSVPVFVLPPGTRAAGGEAGPRPPTDLAPLVAELRSNGEGSVLTLSNAGPQRLRLSQLTRIAADGERSVLVPGLLGYVLAGQSMSWRLPPAGPPGNATLEARFNDDEQAQALPLGTAGR
jgi:fimbrial chaperone protein